MEYEIKSYVGVGPIRFGMTPEQVRHALQSDFERAKKSSSDIPSDFFKSLGIFVDYRSPGNCQAAEFAGPAPPTFEGRRLLKRPYDEVERWIKTLDPDVLMNDAGFRSEKFGWGVYAPSANKEPHFPIEGVIVFDREYYRRSQ